VSAKDYEGTTLKIAFGMIVRSVDSDLELMRFVDNAQKFGHRLECLIVAYTHRLNPQAVRNLNEKVPLIAININAPQYCTERFTHLGMTDSTKKTLLDCPVDAAGGLVPYGFNRNLVVIEALLRKMDILIFSDSDVIPAVLTAGNNENAVQEVDFFGAHLSHLQSDVKITTGEYSGYNILPPASFDGMEELLEGLQKSDMLSFWQTSSTHKGLAVQAALSTPKPCTKVLGGNVAIKLDVFKVLPPFYSTHYYVGKELFLGRGEDTVLGTTIAQKGISCMDIGLNPLHDTFMDYPNPPDLLRDKAVQQRLYYACTGWVGRNPFLNYLLGKDLESTRQYQREKLITGLDALSKYTSNPKYETIIKNFDISWGSVKRYTEEYEQTMGAWRELTERNE